MYYYANCKGEGGQQHLKRCLQRAWGMSREVGLLAAVRAAPPKQSGKVAAAVLCSSLGGIGAFWGLERRWVEPNGWTKGLGHVILKHVMLGTWHVAHMEGS